MALSPQANLIAVVYVLSIIIGIGMSFKAGTFGMNSIFGTLVTLALLSLILYDTQCLTQGNCGTWSWIRSVLYVLLPSIGLIMMAVSLFQKKDVQAPTTTPSMATMSSMPSMPSFSQSE